MEIKKESPTELKTDDLGITSETPKYPAYALIEKRRQSFHDWPSSTHVKPDVLAEAGFFYTCMEDGVRCFYCSGGLRRWHAEDDPWVVHARFYPQCPFVALVKGRSFVDIIKQAASEPVSFDGRPQQETAIDGIRTGQGEQATSGEDHLSSFAAQSCIRSGFSEKDVERAIRIYMETNGTANFTGTDLYEILGDIKNSLADVAASADTLSAPDEDETSKENGEDESDDNSTEDVSIEDLYAENCRRKENQLCKICLDGEASVIFLPCGHMVSCPQCSPAFAKCPMCREQVKGLAKAYFSAT